MVIACLAHSVPIPQRPQWALPPSVPYTNNVGPQEVSEMSTTRYNPGAISHTPDFLASMKTPWGNSVGKRRAHARGPPTPNLNESDMQELYRPPNARVNNKTHWRHGPPGYVRRRPPRLPFNNKQPSKPPRFLLNQNDYELEAKHIADSPILGQGGYGAVYEVEVTLGTMRLFGLLRHRVPSKHLLRDGMVVAVKVQKMDSVLDEDRAVNEVKFQADMAKTGFAPRIYASGLWTHDGISLHFTAMELVRGKTLASYLEARGHVRPLMFERIERAVITMWMRGYAHTDLNPNNIIIRPDQSICIIDYGMATRLPANLVPRNRAHALSGAYQNRLLRHLNGMHVGYPRYAPEPHILRWLYAHMNAHNRMSNVQMARNH